MQGEYESGMTKEPIEVIPSTPEEKMHPASRIRFGKIFPVECNVKVKDIGMVHPDHIPKLIKYWKDEDRDDDDDHEE